MDNTPDIFTFWRPESKWNVDKYIEKGAIADLTDWVNEDEFFTDLFPEYAWRTATVNDRIYCIPRLNFYVEFLVNQEIFDFITRFLNGQPCEWDDEICRRYAGWHDELYWVINEQVLYKT